MDDLLYELHKVEHLMQEGKLSRALKLLENLSKEYPENYLVISMLGEAYLYAGRPDKAIKPLQWATKTFETQEEFEDNDGEEKKNMEDLKNLKDQEYDPEYMAVKRLKKAFRKREDNPWYDHFLLGCAYGRCMKLKRAIRHLTVADQLNPNNTEVIRNLGWIYCMLEEIDLGRRLLKKAIELDPYNALAHNDLGASFMFNGELTEAENWIRKAQELDPEDKFIKNTAEKLGEMIILKSFESLKKVK